MAFAPAVPDYLRSTYDLLNRAYPCGIPDADYLAVIEILLPEMSFMAASEILAHFVNAHRTVYNDILKVASGHEQASRDDLIRVRVQLQAHGLDAWIAEA